MIRCMTRRAALALAAAVLQAGCEAAGAPSSVSVRDSAGVEIVENGRIKEFPVAFTISPAARLDLGGARKTPAEELDSRSPFLDAARLSDGGYVVSDMSVLKVFDAAGKYRSTIGREGEGPGEFRQLRGVCVAPGDTIVAIAYFSPRVSVFARDGTHLRTTSTGESSPEGSGCFEDGSYLVRARSRPNPASALPADQASALDRINTVRRIGRDGGDLGVVGEFPAESSDMSFGGIANLVPHGKLIYVGDGRLPEIRVYTAEGALVRIIRWDQALIPVTDELVMGQALGSVPRGTPQSEIDRRVALVRSRPHHDHVPAYFHIQIDGAGRIWVQDHPIESPSPWPWTVLDPTGRALGRVVLPVIPGSAFSEIASIGENEVLMAWRDKESGFAHLSFHALQPVK